ncbi:unnamed protein product [Ambrosiozyma monospora]|uniref:Unnamed protein product n=1 Tax=Ambrosiozyma monospora TaxID=43982 RepID=A0A9W7DF60_AMBMO|nr:unnamed protein product [Ambrosiozyma monospora]
MLFRNETRPASDFDPDNLPYYNPEIDRRVCFITGGNSGIGFYTVLHLYIHGFIIYVGGRSKQKTESAFREIRNQAKIRRGKLTLRQLDQQYLGDLKFVHLDLLDLKSVCNAVVQFKTREKYLNLLVHNAGIMAVPYSKTKDDFEIQLQTNYISPFLITDRLVNLMEHPDVKDPRIVYVSSIGHRFAVLPINLGFDFPYKPNILFTFLRYGHAKTAGIHMAKTIAKRHPTILSVSVHPGFVMNTNLFSHFTRLPFIGTLFWIFFQLFGFFFGVSNEEGSYSTLKCGVSNDLNRDEDNGKYFATFGVETTPSRIAEKDQYSLDDWGWTVSELQRRGFQITN